KVEVMVQTRNDGEGEDKNRLGSSEKGSLGAVRRGWAGAALSVWNFGRRARNTQSGVVKAVWHSRPRTIPITPNQMELPHHSLHKEQGPPCRGAGITGPMKFEWGQQSPIAPNELRVGYSECAQTPMSFE